MLLKFIKTKEVYLQTDYLVGLKNCLEKKTHTHTLDKNSVSRYSQWNSVEKIIRVWYKMIKILVIFSTWWEKEDEEENN